MAAAELISAFTIVSSAIFNEVTAPSAIFPVVTASPPISFVPTESSAIIDCEIVFAGSVTVPVNVGESRNAIVPEASGIVIVLSAVGSVTVIVVSKSFGVEPSRTMLPSVIIRLLIFGLVNVLFVRVCVAESTTSVPAASGNETVRSAVGSPAARVSSKSFAVVPSKTTDELSTPTEVISEMLPVVITVPETSGKVIARSAVGSVIVRVVSKSFAVAPSKTMLEPKAGLTVELMSAK